MAQTTFGQTDALALAVATWLNGMSFCIPITAERRFRLIDELPAIPDTNAAASVDVFPDVENSERQGMSLAFHSEYAIHVYIQQKLSLAADEEAQCALLAQLRSQIIESLKPLTFDLTNAVAVVRRVFLWQVKSADRKGLYDLQRLLQQHVFESDTVLVYRAAV